MMHPKKSDNAVTRLHLYLNYGLLGLASILAKAGYRCQVVHGRFEEPEDVVRALMAEREASCNVLLLSVPSSFALPWARRASAEVRRICPQMRIVVGGRWVVADDEQWIRDQLPDADQIVSGLADDRILNLVRTGQAHLVSLAQRRIVNSPVGSPELDYGLLANRADFHPSLEVSRGCGMHCSFCAEAEEPLSAIKDPSQLAAEFAGLVGAYKSTDIHPYLEASLFRPSTRWVTDFRSALGVQGIRLSWRAETRVDTLSPRLVEQLAETGFKVVDLGLESASPAQLRRMKKATQPDVYLRRASELLRACRDCGVWAKVNVLLHPGETTDTIAETEAWLEEHRNAIKGVSVGSTILFRYGQASVALLREFEALGARVVDSGALDRDGFANLHLSRTLPYERAAEESTRISRSFMSKRDYFDLKSFSYLPRGFTWDAFQAATTAGAAAKYSFRD
jgi:hypothetical protein